jgi:hypothetical protein
VGDDSHFVFRQKLLSEEGSVRRGVVLVQRPGLFSPKFGATSSHVFTQSPQNIAVEPGIHSLVYWDWCCALPQLFYRWRHQYGIFWILLLLLALQPTVGFSILGDFLPFCSFFALLSPLSYSHYLQVFFNALNPSLPWSSSDSHAYGFLL